MRRPRWQAGRDWLASLGTSDAAETQAVTVLLIIVFLVIMLAYVQAFWNEPVGLWGS